MILETYFIIWYFTNISTYKECCNLLLGLTCINSGSHLLFNCIQNPKVEFFHNFTYEFKILRFVKVLGSKTVLFLVGHTQFGYHIYNDMLLSFLCSLVFISSFGPSFLVSTYKISAYSCILNFFHCFCHHLCMSLVHLAPLFCFNITSYLKI
jgi:hypothetical protein